MNLAVSEVRSCRWHFVFVFRICACSQICDIEQNGLSSRSTWKYEVFPFTMGINYKCLVTCIFAAESFVYQRSVSHQLGSNACVLKIFWRSFGSSFYLQAKTTFCQVTKQCNWGPTKKQEAQLPLTRMLKPSHISNSFRTFKGSQVSKITNTKRQ